MAANKVAFLAYFLGKTQVFFCRNQSCVTLSCMTVFLVAFRNPMTEAVTPLLCFQKSLPQSRFPVFIVKQTIVFFTPQTMPASPHSSCKENLFFYLLTRFS